MESFILKLFGYSYTRLLLQIDLAKVCFYSLECLAHSIPKITRSKQSIWFYSQTCSSLVFLHLRNGTIIHPAKEAKHWGIISGSFSLISQIVVHCQVLSPTHILSLCSSCLLCTSSGPSPWCLCRDHYHRVLPVFDHLGHTLAPLPSILLSAKRTWWK